MTMQPTHDDGCCNFDDVRMRGFRERATVEQVWQWLDERDRPLSFEEVPLASAFGRVLASPVMATSARWAMRSRSATGSSPA